MRNGKVLLKDGDWKLYYEWCFERGPNDSMVLNLMFVFNFVFTIVSEKIKELP